MNIKLEINEEFKKSINLMEQPDTNLFITGKAGVGKSTLLMHFCENTKKSYVVLAPTGVAALNVKGQTIHRFFNFYVDITPNQISKGEVKPKKSDKELYRKLETIIIDEISMVRADLLDCIEIFLRKYGPKPNTVFGGVKMIFIGDLYQLPPVVISKEKEIFENHYESPYFFSSHAIKGTEIKIIELEKIYRQKDVTFIRLLNKIRNNSVDDADIQKLNQRYNPDYNEKESGLSINLTSTNNKAGEINNDYLSKIKNKEYTARGQVLGEFDKSSYPTLLELKYKVGAQVMMLNNDSKNRWVNGTIGIIENRLFDEGDGQTYLIIRFSEKNKSYKVKPHEWEISKYYYDTSGIRSEVMGSFIQFPIRLAWAITIHKGQGKTFNNVVIDIERGVFATGQMYVALSRCTSFEGIVLKKQIKKNHIRTDYRIFKFLTGDKTK